MRISKEVMSGALEIFDKHFPTEKNTPLKDKKKNRPYLNVEYP